MMAVMSTAPDWARGLPLAATGGVIPHATGRNERMGKRHVDYVKTYAANLTPVIPHNAGLAFDVSHRSHEPRRRQVSRRATAVGRGWRHTVKSTWRAPRWLDEMGAQIVASTPVSPASSRSTLTLKVKDDEEPKFRVAIEAFRNNLAGVAGVDLPKRQASGTFCVSTARCRAVSISPSCRATASAARCSSWGPVDISTCMASPSAPPQALRLAQ